MTTTTSIWFVAAVATLCLLIGIARTWIDSLRSREQLINARAQRLMLRFCRYPTQGNYSAVWDFISDNDVRLGDLDWSIVREFTFASMRTNFTINADA